MKNMINWTDFFRAAPSVVVAILVLTQPILFAKLSRTSGATFDDPLVLIEVVSVQPFDSSKDDRFVVKTKDRVHEAIGKVVDVFDGPEDLVGETFPLASPPYTVMERGPESLTPNVLEFEGVADKNLLPVGARMVLPVMRIKDYNYAKQNHFGFPDRSVFFTIIGTGFQLDKVLPEQFKKRLDWAEAIKHFNMLGGEDDRMAYLKDSIRSENPLLAVTAVHLLKRYDPQDAEEYFGKIVLDPGVSVYARIAMDHELCLSLGQTWIDGRQEELEPILQEEAAEVSDGQRLLSFRKQMIENGSWFGGRGERE